MSDTAEFAELLANCRSHAQTLREIGEETMASDIERLIAAYVHELGGGRRG
jgi:hypothetical protein